MKNITLLLLLFISGNIFTQNNIGLLKKDSLPLTKKEFSSAVKQEFSTLLGNDEKSMNNSITTKFDKDETSISAKFLIAPNFMNKDNQYKHSLSGNIKVGESNNFLDLGKSKMPIIDLSIKYNWIISKTWFYKKLGETEKNKSKKIIKTNDSLIQDGNKIMYYQQGGFKKKKVYNWTFKEYHWLTPAINYTNAKYQIFDVTKPFDEQIFNETYSGFSGNIGYNYYGKWIKENKFWEDYVRPHYFYFTVNYEFKKGNNVNTFEKVEITDYQQINSGNIIREVSFSKTAYKGNYKTSIQHNISSEVLLGIQKNISLDLFGNVQITEKESPIYTYGGGFYFLVKNKKDETTINLGLFIKKEGDKDPFLGFKTSLPISL